jgi:uncharacterized protein YhaN
MKIENIHIEGFGIWSDKSWGPLEPGLNVFHGPNETGKSTLMALVRSILFGFDRRGNPRRYEPVCGGAHGGWLDVSVDNRPMRIERKAGRHVRGTVTVYDGESTGSEPELEKLLAGTTRTLYHNVFAFGLEELEQFHTLQDTEVAQHISGAGLGIGASKWAAVQRDIDARQSALFLPRGQNGSINVALKELEAVRDDLDRTEHQPEEYWAAHEARIRLAAELNALEEIVGDLKQRASQYEKRLKSRPNIEKRKSIETNLAALPIVEAFPEGGIERLTLLRNQVQVLQGQSEAARREADQRRMRRMDLKAQSDPAAQERLNRSVETLRNLIPRMDASRRIYEASVDRLDATNQESEAHHAALSGLRPPSRFAVFGFIALMWCGAAGIALAGHLYSGLALLAVSLTPLWWYRRRSFVFSTRQLKAADCAQRLEAWRSEVRRVAEEAREIEAEARRLTGKSEVTQQDIDFRVAEIERLSKVAEEMRRVEDSVVHSEEELTRIDDQIAERQAEIGALLLEAQASGEEEFLTRGETWKLRQQLIHELERIPEEAPEPAMLFDLRGNEQEAYEATLAELESTQQRLDEVRHESGRVDERISIMERSEERARTLARQELIMAKIVASSEMWAVLTLCKTLLDETRKIYENERQPEVLRQASAFYKVMTDGRYSRVIAPLDGGDIQVERSDGVRLSPELLSRGTAEQLYLAMRLALVREYAGHMDPLPVVFDDVFVNFDPERTRNTLRAVGNLADSHQILLFTCHPHVVELVGEVAPAARIFSLL